MKPQADANETDPKQAAERLYADHKGETAWLDRFTACLDQYRSGAALERVLSVWGLSQAEAARLFGISRQAFGKWLAKGVPAERATAIADLSAATDLLVHYLKRDRIAAVVRRPIPALKGVTLLELVARWRTRWRSR